MQGKIINGFTLKRFLGTGGMAEVWYAENKIGKKAAVKILSEKLSHDDQMQERFLNEAKVMVALDHPNIRKVYNFDEIDGRPAIIMEYLDGSDLKSRMKNGQRFTQEELEKWWNQMVDALNYTHAQDIVHRDIKPSNIFIDQKGNAKLLDFGIAKVTDTTTGTLTGSTLGTRIYMSPEQVKDPKRVGTASDEYSLAVSFVHLLTGKAPYDNTTSSDYDIQVSIVTKPVDMSKVPAEWRSFLTPYLQKEADKRPELRHYEIMLKDGREAKQKDDDETITDGPKPQTTEQPSAKEPHNGLDSLSHTPNDKPQNRKALWIGLGIAAAIMVAVFVALLLWPQNPYKKADRWLAKSEKVYQAYCLAETKTDYADPIDRLNAGYTYCLKGAIALKELDSLLPEKKTRIRRCDSIESLYIENVSAIVEKELKNVDLDQDTAAGIGRLRQLEAFAGFNTDEDDNVMRKRIENHVYSLRHSMVVVVNGVPFTMKLVEGGAFQMGAQNTDTIGQNYDSKAKDDESPVHSVILNSFYMGETEVTQALWKAVMGNNPSHFKGDSLPVEGVSFVECGKFIVKLNKLTNGRFRLPTEAEWEYAARGGKRGDGGRFSGSYDLECVAWYETNSDDRTHPVKCKQSNELGLYDMSGNVFEWCSDGYNERFYSYSNLNSDNPVGLSSDYYRRVYRGGNFMSDEDGCRVSQRNNYYYEGSPRYCGFRICLPQLITQSKPHEYVDLGLPSGTLWATCNIGASNPEDYGSYFAWGDTTEHSTYDWKTYKYANGDYNKLTKYCNKSDYGNGGFTDNLTELQPSDDPATTNWGSGWRTPNKAQWEELKNHTTHKWTMQNDKKGLLFTSKKNGQTLFLPAAGYWGIGVLYDTGSCGYYWSRSLHTDIPILAWYLSFHSDDCCVSNGKLRGCGFSVRPVREK